MRKIRIALVAVAAAGLMVGVVSEATAGGGKATVKLGDNFFSPESKSVSKGTKVRFKWIGSNAHNVVKKRGPGGNFASTTTAAPGINFTKRFKKRGTYKIICTLHDKMKMSLTVF